MQLDHVPQMQQLQQTSVPDTKTITTLRLGHNIMYGSVCLHVVAYYEATHKNEDTSF